MTSKWTNTCDERPLDAEAMIEKVAEIIANRSDVIPDVDETSHGNPLILVGNNALEMDPDGYYTCWPGGPAAMEIKRHLTYREEGPFIAASTFLRWARIEHRSDDVDMKAAVQRTFTSVEWEESGGGLIGETHYDGKRVSSWDFRRASGIGSNFWYLKPTHPINMTACEVTPIDEEHVHRALHLARVRVKGLIREKTRELEDMRHVL